ncbi:MAG: chemotaxis protein CheC [Clostridiales bacterium]|nr:chemotaxis protein CheC [Clostridiales bacterium]
MSEGINELDSNQLDVLREIGNIGAGNAATALAKMINKKVDMGVPRVKILEFKNVTDILGDAESIVVGILLKVEGDITGSIMFILNVENARSLIKLIVGAPLGNEAQFNDMEISALQEIGNILAGSYLSSMSTLTNLNIYPSVPLLAIDMAGAILSVPAIEFGKVGDNVLYIETEFSEGDERIVGDFFLVPDPEMYGVLMKALGVA